MCHDAPPSDVWSIAGNRRNAAGKTLRDLLAAWHAEGFAHPRRAAHSKEVFCIEPSSAMAELVGGWITLFAVACGRGLLVLRDRLRTSPSSRQYQRILAALDLECVGDEQPAAEPNRGAWPFLELLDWIRATAMLKQVKMTSAAVAAWNKIHARHCRDLDQAKFGRSVSFSVLVKARTRLDIVCMLGARAIFSKERFVDVDVYSYTGASPQWRGTELQASSMDIVRRRTGARSHHLVPCTRLSFDLRDAVGKCVGLLHQLFLCVGPDYDFDALHLGPGRVNNH